MNARTQSHLVVVESYQGAVEFLSDEREEQQAFLGLGLPVEELARLLDCRITVLCWDEWYPCELQEVRVTFPATRPIAPPAFCPQVLPSSSARLKRVSIAPVDPDYGLHFDKAGLSPRSHGLINDNGYLFFVSCCLRNALLALACSDPFHAVILPMWGGLGYVAQMVRATRAPGSVDVPFAVVVTDTSANRATANQEGHWVRQNIVRRQMEDVSLALADLVLVFGPRAEAIALRGRLPEASIPVTAPRFVDPFVLDAVARASDKPLRSEGPLQFFLHEPQEGASGVLATLDALDHLAGGGLRLDRPLLSSGPSMVFSPMRPRSFHDYWGTRGAVRRLLRELQWRWQADYPQFDGAFPVRLYPSFFDHLPHVWSELARGSLVLLSPAAAEGLAPGERLPGEVLIGDEPTPENIAAALENISHKSPLQLDQIRRELCARVISAQRQGNRANLLERTAAAIDGIVHGFAASPDLGRISLLFLDRRQDLRRLADTDIPPSRPELSPAVRRGRLSVVVTCYEMGTMISTAVRSVWDSECRPEEVLLIDDGSDGRTTLKSIEDLEEFARQHALPLRVIRQRNRGLAAARNVGLEAAAGEFISFMDGDDSIEPGFYGTTLPLLEAFPRLGGVAAWASIFGAYDGLWNAPQAELPFLFVENAVIVPCVMRAELLRRLGGYDVRQRYNYEDWELSLRLLLAGWPILTIPACLLKYRIRDNSMFHTITDVQNQVMRETLLSRHREAASAFAVEIAMQLEHRYKQLLYAAGTPGINQENTVPSRSQPMRFARRTLNRLFSTRQDRSEA